ncbi:hypothetical protein [Vibrio ouci]|uniref:Uncharacterized protein n=1 Tax=Vibrio ouci TaxID=2499078 RepID=A0A4Y8WA84_9VIBR|nr:hypothetical protein [Vibrio ouci]TFH89849.1 hypothetical protein ELS82_19970 [Vibrio ouci]
MKKSILSLTLLLSFPALSNPVAINRANEAQLRLDSYSEAELAKPVFDVTYREFLEKVVFINSVPEGGTLVAMQDASSCNGIYDYGYCIQFEATAAGIEQQIIASIVTSVFPGGNRDNNESNSPVLTPVLPAPNEPEQPIFIIDPIDPGFGVAPIDPGYGIEPIGEEEDMPVIGLGSFRAMSLEEQAEVLTRYINNNNSSSKGKVVVVDGKLLWETSKGKQKQLKDSSKILEVLEEAHKERLARRDDRIIVDPIDVIVEPIEPVFGVDPLPPYDENAPIVSPVLWGHNLAVVKSWTGAINPASLESYKAMIAMANSPEGKIATLKMMLVNEISVSNILNVLENNEEFVSKYPQFFTEDHFGNPKATPALEKLVEQKREAKWSENVNSYYQGIADIYENIEDGANKLKFATLLDSFMIGGSNKSLLDVMQGNGYLKDVPTGDRDRELAGDILDKAKEHWLDNTVPGGRVITDAEKHALALHRIFGKAGMEHLQVSIVDGKVQVFNPNNGKILNEKQIMTKLTKAASKNAEARREARETVPGERVDEVRRLTPSEQALALDAVFKKAGFYVEVYHNKKDGDLAITLKDGTVYTIVPSDGNGTKSGTLDEFKLAMKKDVKSDNGKNRRDARREERHQKHDARTPNRKNQFNGERVKRIVKERRNK